MLHFLLMLTTLKANIILQTTCTDFVNDWDKKIDWTAGRNRLVTGLYSEHNNHREDRRWKFCHGGMIGISTSSCGWSATVNDWDNVLSYTCPHNHAIDGFISEHNNHREDRQWKIRCCEVHGSGLVDQGWGDYRNNMDGKLDYKCNRDEVVTGLYSYHNNWKEDRRWKIRCAKLIGRTRPSYPIRASLSGYKNSWDGTLHWDAGKNGMITGFDSYHDNHREDRRWRFYSGVTHLTCDQGGWSGYKNSWDGKLSFSCPDRWVLNGVYSKHDNGKEDRRWKFKCCQLPNTVTVTRHAYSDYINNWDERMTWFCPEINQAVVSLWSEHSNHREDRRWKVQCGEILWKP